MRLSILGPGGTGEIPIRIGFEIGPGDVFVAFLLAYVTAYLYLLEPIEMDAEQKGQLRELLLAVVLPLSVTFVGVLLFTIFDRGLLLYTPITLG